MWQKCQILNINLLNNNINNSRFKSDESKILNNLCVFIVYLFDCRYSSGKYVALFNIQN